jgi:hypothetical protein
MTAESTEDKILKGLVQVFTRGKTNYVALQIRDSTGLPPYEIPIGLAEFIKYLESCDLATLTIREMLDLGTLYFPMIENLYLKELKRRADTDPMFKDRLKTEILPRLRLKSDPDWRYNN